MKTVPRLLYILACSMFVAVGCDSHVIPPGSGDGAIAFGLVLPDNLIVTNYLAISGAYIKDDYIAGDSTLKKYPKVSFYAQFSGVDSTLEVPSVLLNGTALAHHRGGDTLRLNDSPSGIAGDHTWKLIAPGTTDTTTFVAKTIDVLDTVQPFVLDKPVRSDTSLYITWARPVNNSSLAIIWKNTSSTPPYTYSSGPQFDVGSFTVPAATMAKLRGSGTITLIRYINSSASYKGKSVTVIRVCERAFDVIVQ